MLRCNWCALKSVNPCDLDHDASRSLEPAASRRIVIGEHAGLGGRDLAHPSCAAGHVRLCARGCGPDDRRSHEPVARRDPWRRERSITTSVVRPPAGMSSSSAGPKRARRSARSRSRITSKATARHRLARNDTGRPHHAGAGLLPRALRLRARGPRRRCARFRTRPGDVRCRPGRGLARDPDLHPGRRPGGGARGRPRRDGGRTLGRGYRCLP